MAADEYGRAVALFVQLHGDLPIASIGKAQARRFREALQFVPRKRTGQLLKATLPQLAEYGRAHPEVQKNRASTINKLLTGVQSVTSWAEQNGFVPDDARWSDPFSRMRLEETEPEREAFTQAELLKVFGAPVFTQGERPQGGRGEAAFWLPLIALFGGLRLSEIASLSVDDFYQDEDGRLGAVAFQIADDADRGKRLKTASSKRLVPVHPELIRLGLLTYAQQRRTEDGPQAWLFPTLAPGTTGAQAWSKWFGRYLGSVGITDRSKVFHSFRHSFKDALRAAPGVSEEVSDVLTGHTSGAVGRSYGSKDMTLRFGKRLTEAVDAVAYPGLDLTKLATHRAASGRRPAVKSAAAERKRK